METIYLDEGENADWIKWVWVEKIKTKNDLLFELERRDITIEQFKKLPYYNYLKKNRPKAIKNL